MATDCFGSFIHAVCSVLFFWKYQVITFPDKGETTESEEQYKKQEDCQKEWNHCSICSDPELFVLRFFHEAGTGMDNAFKVCPDVCDYLCGSRN